MKIFKKIRRRWHLDRFGDCYLANKILYDLAKNEQYPLLMRCWFSQVGVWFAKKGYYHLEEYMCQDAGPNMEPKLRKIFRDNEVKGL